DSRAGLLDELTARQLFDARNGLSLAHDRLTDLITARLKSISENLSSRQSLLAVLDPALPIRRGYAIVRANGRIVRRGRDTSKGAIVSIEVSDADIGAQVKSIYAK
ncbi:MAG: exodeoxyribonuclease VII large subunit, partial [Candidatus Saccharimonadales bacterium]